MIHLNLEEVKERLSAYDSPIFIKGKGNVYCKLRYERGFKCPRNQKGNKLPGRNKCYSNINDICPNARFEAPLPPLVDLETREEWYREWRSISNGSLRN